MAKHNLESTVNWPVTSYYGDEDEQGYGYRNSGEGGLMVYAVWGYITAPSCLNDVYLDTSEVLVSAEGPLAELISRHQKEAQSADVVGGGGDWNLRVSAAVLISSTGESIYGESFTGSGDYFSVDRSDLTESGLAIVTALEALYGEPATLVTFLDT